MTSLFDVFKPFSVNNSNLWYLFFHFSQKSNFVLCSCINFLFEHLFFGFLWFYNILIDRSGRMVMLLVYFATFIMFFVWITYLFTFFIFFLFFPEICFHQSFVVFLEFAFLFNLSIFFNASKNQENLHINMHCFALQQDKSLYVYNWLANRYSRFAKFYVNQTGESICKPIWPRFIWINYHHYNIIRLERKNSFH